MAPAASPADRRETRLLLVIIAVAAAALFLLARFRFPQPSTTSSDPAPAPLERLAARAAFEELTAAMTDLERRIAPGLLMFRVHPSRPSGGYVVAPRVSSARAVAILADGESLLASEGAPDVVAVDAERALAVVNVQASDQTVVAARTASLRAGPRYVVAVEGSPQGPTLRPLYVGRLTAATPAGTPLTLLTLEAVQAPVSRGSAVFSLDGTFLGLVATAGPVVTLYAAESLRATADAAQRADPRPRGDLGLDVQDADALLLKAAGADRGVIVTHVRGDGPADSALRTGDVIRAIDGLETNDAATFRMLERTREAGAPTTVQFVRRGSQQQVTYRAAPAGSVAATEDLGLTGRSVQGGPGVEVVTVNPNGIAFSVGLRRGDLLLTLDGAPLTSLSMLTRAFRTAKANAVVVIGFERGGQHRVVALEKR